VPIDPQLSWGIDDDNEPVWPTRAVGAPFRGARCIHIRFLRRPLIGDFIDNVEELIRGDTRSCVTQTLGPRGCVRNQRIGHFIEISKYYYIREGYEVTYVRVVAMSLSNKFLYYNNKHAYAGIPVIVLHI
jgi:hypothetical protein